MKCIYCGEEFEQKRANGKKYCDKLVCKRKAMVDCQKRYMQRKKNKEKEIVEEVKIEENNEKTIIYSAGEKLDNQLSADDISDIVQLAKDYGTVRFQLTEKVQACREKISICDKTEQDLLHQLENLNEVTTADAISTTIDIKKNREIRRVHKNREYLIQFILESMPLRNAQKFVVEAVQRSKNYEYVPRVLKGLKKNKELYTQNNVNEKEAN